MIFQDLRDTDYSDLGSAATSVKITLLVVVLVLLLVAGYFLLIEDKKIELEQSRQQELVLLADLGKTRSSCTYCTYRDPC